MCVYHQCNAESKLSCPELFFVEPSVKVDGRCYQDVWVETINAASRASHPPDRARYSVQLLSITDCEDRIYFMRCIAKSL